jgi:hypothetical protein
MTTLNDLAQACGDGFPMPPTPNHGKPTPLP